jgi:hypothetical protein
VLRIPGTINAKDPATPKAVEVYSLQGRRYTPDEIRAYLDSAAIPDPQTEECAKEKFAQRFSDSPLAVNLRATIPEEQLSEWSKRDPRFRRTWNHERDDLRDQSASGYDLALACFGVQNGLADQQIIDLIIHHRRLHGASQRKTVDYFQRTIGKARREEPAPAGGTYGLPQNGGPHLDNDGPGSAVDEIARKAEICQQLSSVLGIRLLRIQKVPGAEPVFLMELENGRIAFDIARLTTQRSIKLALAGKVGKVMPTFKPRHWTEITQMMLDACVVVDSTDDLQFEGAARIHLHKYLADNPVLPDVEQATRRDILKPVIFKGQVTVHTTDLHSYLAQTSKLSASIQELAGMITALGARAVRIREGAYADQSRWGLPVDQFPPQAYRDTEGSDVG